ncbi:MAG: GNAT family N-acetyltransferase [Myxococcota bacterium]
MLEVRRPRPGEGGALLRLFQACFAEHGSHPGHAAGALRGPTWVAALEDEPVGFGCMMALHGSREPELRRLLGCLSPDARALLEPLADPLLAGGATEAPAVRVEAPAELRIELGARDVRFTALGVLPSHRRLGIGTLLARARLARAIERGATQVFVDCVAGSGSRELYERIGFTPLVTKARHYRGGAGMTLMHTFL